MTDLTPELRAELDEAWGHVAELTKALTGLTCGGSEFFIRCRGRYIADTKACVDWVRRRERVAHERVIRLTAELKTSRAALEQQTCT